MTRQCNGYVANDINAVNQPFIGVVILPFQVPFCYSSDISALAAQPLGIIL